MKPQKSFRRVQLLAVAALMGAGLLALMLVMVSLTGVSVAAGLGAAPSGFVKIGDYVWYDVNANGSFGDAGEGQYIGGINGVRINLYKDLDGNGLIDPGEFLKSTVTSPKPSTPGSKGWYEFADVPTGAVYLVQIDPSNFAPGGALVGMALTSAGTIGPEPREVDIPLNGADRCSHRRFRLCRVGRDGGEDRCSPRAPSTRGTASRFKSSSPIGASWP